MKTPSDTHIRDILSRIDRIQRHIETYNAESFFQDEVAVDAVSHNIFYIGQAAGYIPQSVRDAAPNIDWLTVENFRDQILQSRMDEQTVWDTATRYLPVLKSQAQNLLNHHR